MKEMEIMVIIKSNITQQVVQFIKENIDNGNWRIGEKIPSENKLAESLGVSRASVRMAIQQFIAIGVLESVHGKGTFVKSSNLNMFGKGINGDENYDIEDLNKALEFRLLVESGGCFLATQRASKENLERLQFYLDQMKENIGNSEEFVKYDMLFHEEITKASGNSLLERSLKEVFMQKNQNHRQLNEIFGYKDGIYYHTVILEAMKNKNAKKAKQLMEEHLKKAINELNEPL